MGMGMLFGIGIGMKWKLLQEGTAVKTEIRHGSCRTTEPTTPAINSGVYVCFNAMGVDCNNNIAQSADLRL